MLCISKYLACVRNGREPQQRGLHRISRAVSVLVCRDEPRVFFSTLSNGTRGPSSGCIRGHLVFIFLSTAMMLDGFFSESSRLVNTKHELKRFQQSIATRSTLESSASRPHGTHLVGTPACCLAVSLILFGSRVQALKTDAAKIQEVDQREMRRFASVFGGPASTGVQLR